MIALRHQQTTQNPTNHMCTI